MLVNYDEISTVSSTDEEQADKPLNKLEEAVLEAVEAHSFHVNLRYGEKLPAKYPALRRAPYFAGMCQVVQTILDNQRDPLDFITLAFQRWRMRNRRHELISYGLNLAPGVAWPSLASIARNTELLEEFLTGDYTPKDFLAPRQYYRFWCDKVAQFVAVRCKELGVTEDEYWTDLETLLEDFSYDTIEYAEGLKQREQLFEEVNEVTLDELYEHFRMCHEQGLDPRDLSTAQVPVYVVEGELSNSNFTEEESPNEFIPGVGWV